MFRVWGSGFRVYCKGDTRIVHGLHEGFVEVSEGLYKHLRPGKGDLASNLCNIWALRGIL